MVDLMRLFVGEEFTDVRSIVTTTIGATTSRTTPMP